MKRIFILEDDTNISSIIAFNVKAAGYEPVCESDGKAGLLRLLQGGYDLAILDVMLPSMSGFEVLKELRKESDIPVIILSARDTEDDKLQGLSLMADDYMTKPFSMKELIARIKVNLARCEKEKNTDSVLSAGGISVNSHTLAVTKGGAEIAVSKKEAQILLLLFKNRGKILSREDILEKVWGYNGYLGDTHTVDVAIGRLRAKIEDTPSEPKVILSRRGAGYYVL